LQGLFHIRPSERFFSCVGTVMLMTSFSDYESLYRRRVFTIHSVVTSPDECLISRFTLYLARTASLYLESFSHWLISFNSIVLAGKSAHRRTSKYLCAARYLPFQHHVRFSFPSETTTHGSYDVATPHFPPPYLSFPFVIMFSVDSFPSETTAGSFLFVLSLVSCAQENPSSSASPLLLTGNLSARPG